MRLGDAVCYILLTITISSSCVRGEKQNEEGESQPNRRIRKREATILIDNYPFERIYQQPKMVYRRHSEHRYLQPKSKYGPPKPQYGPPKPKYGPPKPKYGPKPRRNSPNKFRPEPKMPKRAAPNHKNRPTKPRYGAPQKLKRKPGYRPPKKAPIYTYFSPEPTGFGEPPVYDYRPPRNTYAEPPVDSYGEPIKPVYEDPSAPSFPTTTDQLDNQEYQPWVNFVPRQNADTAYEYSNKAPVVTKPDSAIYVTPAPIDYDDAIEPEASEPKQSYYVKKKKRLISNTKIVKKPWRLPRRPVSDEEIIVGGQYAEPPGRLVQKFQPSAPMYEDDEEFAEQEPFETIPSATSSPYVNYKNSNMAFSPQNLNDAFSISR